MLRVGLTGGLGSGKSTVAAMLAGKGAYILSADDLGRELMRPGTSVFALIAERFGPAVLLRDGTLDRPALARLAFSEGRAEELNSIVHPATIARQGELAAEIFARDPAAIVVVESALIFETQHGSGWRDRFDRMILVTAPDALKVARFIARSASSGSSAADTAADTAALEAEARRRLARMIPDEQKAKQCDFVLLNQGSLAELQAAVSALWPKLLATKTLFSVTALS